MSGDQALKRSGALFFILLAAPLYVLDQVTKWLVVRTFDYESAHPVIEGFFDLVYFGNTGAAFSMFRNGNVFFISLSVITLAALIVFFRRGAFADRWMQTGLGLLTAGILGNLTDRVLHGHVVDFLLFDLHVPFANPWPAFNVADSCICIAAGLFIIHSIRHPTPKK